MARVAARRMSGFSLILLLVLCLSCALVSHASPTSPSTTPATPSASVDLISSDEVKYVVGLLRSSAASIPPPPDTADSASTDASTGPTIVYMTAASGKKFRCCIPHPSAPSTLAQPPIAATSTSSAESEPDTEAEADEATVATITPHTASIMPTSSSFSSPPSSSSAVSVSASTASAPFMSLGKLSGRLRRQFRTGCFTLSAGWWMYELCPFSAVRQFHSDGTPPAGPDGSRYLSYQISSAFTLGAYDEDADSWLWLSYSGKSIAAGEGAGEWVYAQHYAGGSDGRVTTVRYLCNTSPFVPKANPQQQQQQQVGRAAALDHRLVAVREDATYVYTFDVATPLVCPSATPTNKPQPISRSQSSTNALSATLPAPQQSPVPPPPDYPNAGAELNAALQSLHGLLWEECLVYFQGWWTYKFCYLDALNQFHREARQQQQQQPASQSAQHQPHGTDIVTMAEYELGHFVYGNRAHSAATSHAKGGPAQAASSVSPSEVVMRTSIVRGATWEETYVRQLYTDGTACDVKPGSSRQTEVRFVCDSNSQQQQQPQQQQNNAQQQQQARAQPQKAALMSVSEDSTCHYVAVVAVPALCSHPLFSPELPTVHEIECIEVKDTSR